MVPRLAKKVVLFHKESVATNADSTANVDTLGFDYCQIDVKLDSHGTATNNLSTLKLMESDDTVATNFANITAFVGDGTGGFTIPNAVTEGSQMIHFGVDLRGARKRYLRIVARATGAAQILDAIATLQSGDETPNNATDMNVATVVTG